MVTTPFAEQQMIVPEKSLLEGLMDFSFERIVTPRLLRILYAAHLLLGLIGAIWFVFSQFQASVSNGLLALILSSVGMALWIMYCRIFVELLSLAFRAGQVIANSQN